MEETEPSPLFILDGAPIPNNTALTASDLQDAYNDTCAEWYVEHSTRGPRRYRLCLAMFTLQAALRPMSGIARTH